MEEVIKALSKSKAVDIILLLDKGGELRYTEIKKLGHFATISRRLKDFERLEIVRRDVKAEYPPKVTYRLTKKGTKIVQKLKEIGDMAEA